MKSLMSWVGWGCEGVDEVGEGEVSQWEWWQY